MLKRWWRTQRPRRAALEPGHLQARNDERGMARLSDNELTCLKTAVDAASASSGIRFRFIDLGGIGGIRRGFEAIGGQCVFTSERNKHAVRTYSELFLRSAATRF